MSMNLQQMVNMGAGGGAALFSLLNNGRQAMLDAAAMRPQDGGQSFQQRFQDRAGVALMLHGERSDMPNIPLFAQALEHIFAEIYKIEFNNLPMAEGNVLPHDTSVPNHVETWKYRTLQSYGQAVIGDPGAYGSYPMVSIGGREFQGNVAAVINAFAYTIQEMRVLAAVGGELERMYAEAARRAHEEIMDRVGWWGDKNHNLYGLMTHPNMPVVYAPVGTLNSTKWVDKSFDEIFADVLFLATASEDRTYGREVADLILIPRDVRTLFLSKRIENDSTTLKQHIENNMDGVEIMVCDQLNATHKDNPLGVGYAVAIKRDKSAGSLIVPQEFEMFDPRWEGMRWVTPCHSRIGGVKIPKPYAFTIMPGVS
jgi:hypothetical protein